MNLGEMFVCLFIGKLYKVGIMMRLIWVGLIALMAAGLPAETVQDQKHPFESKSQWYQITIDGATSGSACVVHAAATGQPAGEVKTGYRFLSLGSDAHRIFLAYKGAIVYIPADAATRVYPQNTPEKPYRALGKTLEKQAEELNALRSTTTGLAPKRATPTPTATPASSGRGGGSRSGGGGGGSRGGGGGMH